jgi:hypothetical protein
MYSAKKTASFQSLAYLVSLRQDLLGLLDRLNPAIEGLTQTIEQEAEQSEAQRLKTHPSAGSLPLWDFVFLKSAGQGH